MKYKVGTHVRIRKDLVVDGNYGGSMLTPEKSDFLGNSSYIISYDKLSNLYRLNWLPFWWSEEMLEPVQPIEEKKYPKWMWVWDDDESCAMKRKVYAEIDHEYKYIFEIRGDIIAAKNAKDIEPTQLTRKQIAETFGLNLDEMEIID